MSEDLSRLIDQMKDIVRSNVMPIGAYIVLMTSFWMLIDLHLWHSNVAYLAGSIVDFVVMYGLIASMLWSSGYDHPKPPSKLGGLLVLSLLVGLAVVIGFLFVVAPGLYVMMRWLPAYGHYLSRNTNIGDSMNWSWHATSRMQGALLLLLALALLPILPTIWLSFLDYWPLGLTDVTGSFLINVLGTLGYVAINVLGVAALNLLDDQAHKPA